MNSRIKRLLIAASLSGLGIATTLIWYRSTDSSLVKTGETPLAQVGQVSDEVLRRPPTRLLWHAVNTGDPLFNGEAIRTSAAGEVRIQFEDGRFIDIEPDSLIVLSKAEGEISLDLMEGGLFVNAKADGTTTAGGGGLVLNSAQGKVDLSGASASLSKAQGQNLNLQVVEGSAKVQSKDGKTQELSSGKTGVLGSSGLQFDSSQIKIITPLPNKAVYLDPSKKPEVQFQWAGFPKEWQVSAFVGPGRKQMKELVVAEAGTSQTKSVLPYGKHYWKLVAKDPVSHEVKGESPIFRLEVLARTTPTLLAPSPNAQLEFETFPASVQLVWQKADESNQLVLEVAKDPQLKQKVTSQSLSQVERFNLEKLSEGTYYWRLSSFFPDVKEPWSGPIQQFRLIKKADEKPVQVAIQWEQVNPQQTFVDKPSLLLAWSAGPQSNLVSQWKVSWKHENEAPATAKFIETADRKLEAPVEKPGRYLASVEAYDKKGRLMGRSENLTLQLQPKPLLPAPQLVPAEGPLTTRADGTGEFQWSQIEGAQEYELKILNSEGKELVVKRATNTKMTLENMMPGEYSVSLVSIDSHSRPSPSPTRRTLVVPSKSQLRAPALKKVKVN